MQEGLGFQRKLRQLAKLLQEAWPRVQPSRRFMGFKGAKGAHPGMGDGDSAFQLSQLTCTIPGGAKGSHRPAKTVTGTKKCRSAEYSADRPKVLRNKCRWPLGGAGGGVGKPVGFRDG